MLVKTARANTDILITGLVMASRTNTDVLITGLIKT
jgi:hypothetical protein